jgi:hypothetical protein
MARQSANIHVAGRTIMLELLSAQPWLAAVGLGVLVPIVGIIFGTTTAYLTRVRQAELEIGLKQEMVQRGMSAEEIRVVIEASAYRKRKHSDPEPAGVCSH